MILIAIFLVLSIVFCILASFGTPMKPNPLALGLLFFVIAFSLMNSGQSDRKNPIFGWHKSSLTR